MAIRQYCDASSDDLNCYEFTGGFTCFREPLHSGFHHSEVDDQIIIWGKVEDFPQETMFAINDAKWSETK